MSSRGEKKDCEKMCSNSDPWFQDPRRPLLVEFKGGFVRRKPYRSDGVIPCSLTARVVTLFMFNITEYFIPPHE